MLPQRTPYLSPEAYLRKAPNTSCVSSDTKQGFGTTQSVQMKANVGVMAQWQG